MDKITPLPCLHRDISRDLKPSCIECGLVFQQYPLIYHIRTITYYKELYFKNPTYNIPIHMLLGSKLQQQVENFLKRQYRDKFKNQSGNFPTPQCEVLYMEYINFLRNNSERILPKKYVSRKKEISNVYGDHKKLLIKYISRLSFGSP